MFSTTCSVPLLRASLQLLSWQRSFLGEGGHQHRAARVVLVVSSTESLKAGRGLEFCDFPKADERLPEHRRLRQWSWSGPAAVELRAGADQECPRHVKCHCCSEERRPCCAQPNLQLAPHEKVMCTDNTARQQNAYRKERKGKQKSCCFKNGVDWFGISSCNRGRYLDVTSLPGGWGHQGRRVSGLTSRVTYP